MAYRKPAFAVLGVQFNLTCVVYPLQKRYQALHKFADVAWLMYDAPLTCSWQLGTVLQAPTWHTHSSCCSTAGYLGVSAAVY